LSTGSWLPGCVDARTESLRVCGRKWRLWVAV